MSSIALDLLARSSRRARSVSVRVELIDDAIADLAKHAETGKGRAFCKKLLEIEANGSKAGEPLGRGLVGWRKITVGDRNWRIVFRVDRSETVATVCVIGDREDGACYEQAKMRAEGLEDGDAASLAESMMELFGSRKERKAAQKRRAAEASKN
jgi:mRNA interferase RelE/StbE